MWVAIAGASGFLAVAAGAFGAHALAGSAAPRALAAWETGARYHLVHALALLAVAWLAEAGGGRVVTLAGWCFVSGTVLFSGALYVYGATGTPAFAVAAPVGGTAFLVGWAALAVAGLRRWRARR